MLEVVIEVDGRPLSSFGCDGVVMSTPTGSTAYSFSAGGPVVWPSLDAMLLVPLSPHALFARPLVVGPDSALAVEVLDRTQGTGVLWCDGRRTHDLPPGARVVVRRSPDAGAARPPQPGPVHRPPRAQVPPAGHRLARPASGDGGVDAVIEEISIRDLGVIGEARLPLGPGFTALTGETGAGKTMVVTALGLLLGERADGASIRSGSDQAVVEGRWLVDPSAARSPSACAMPGATSTAASSSSAAPSRRRAAAARSSAAAARRSACSARSAQQLVVVHGQSDQMRLRSATAQREALDRFAGAELATVLGEYQDVYRRWQADQGELDVLVAERDRRCARGRRAAGRDGRDRGGAAAQRRGPRARRARRPAHQPRRPAAGGARRRTRSSRRTVGGRRQRRAGAARRPRAGSSSASPRTTRHSRRSRGARRGILRGDRDSPRSSSSYLATLDADGARELETVQERRADARRLVRKYGPTLDDVIDYLDTGSARLLELDNDSDRIEALGDGRRGGPRAQVIELAARLSEVRRAAAQRLGDAVTAELAALAMPDARRARSRSTTGREYSLSRQGPGLDPAAAAPGRRAAAARRGASGGELSRVMLAIEVVIAGSDPVPTFVFDEVDAGVGGARAIEIGRRLAALSRSRAGDRRHAPRPGRRVRDATTCASSRTATARSRRAASSSSTASSASPRWRGCSRGCPTRRAGSRTRAS